MNPRKWSACVLAVGVALSACGREEKPAPAEPAVATIDGEPVARAAYLDALMEAQGDAFFRRFVETWLVEREARKAGVTVDAEAVKKATDSEIQEMLRKQFGGSKKGLEQQIARYGLSFEDWREGQLRDTRLELLARGILKDRVGEPRVRALFEQRFGKDGVQRSVSHVLISTRLGRSRFYTRKLYEEEKEAVVDAARARAAELRRKVLSGGDFAALAGTHSDDFSGKRGGSLGAKWSGRFGKAFDDTVARLSVGQVSPVIEGRRGFHVVRVDGMRKGARYDGRVILVAAEKEDDFPAARAKAEALRQRLVDGAAFAEVAGEASDDPATRGRGGDLGSFTPGRLGDEVDPVLETIALGEISQPVRTEAGYVLVRLDDREFRPAQDRKLVSHILVSTEYTKVKQRRLADSIEAKAKAKAESLLKAIEGGEALDAVAREHSEDELTRRSGGLIRRFRPGQLGPEVDAAVAEMKPGELRLVKSADGWHVLRLEGEVKSDYEKVKAKLEAELKRKPPSDDDVRAFIDTLRSQAKVDKKF